MYTFSFQSNDRFESCSGIMMTTRAGFFRRTRNELKIIHCWNRLMVTGILRRLIGRRNLLIRCSLMHSDQSGLEYRCYFHRAYIIVIHVILFSIRPANSPLFRDQQIINLLKSESIHGLRFRATVQNLANKRWSEFSWGQ